jgi:hypothetical protein
MTTPIADQSVSWACVVCGHTSWRHHEHCDHCGMHRPAPVVEAKEPSHTPLTEAALTQEIWAKAVAAAFEPIVDVVPVPLSTQAKIVAEMLEHRAAEKAADVLQEKIKHVFNEISRRDWERLEKEIWRCPGTPLPPHAEPK